MKKTYLLALSLPFLLCACSTMHTGVYGLALTEVEGAAPSANAPAPSIANTSTSEAMKYAYSDEFIHIEWEIDSRQFNFRLENKTDRNMRLIWDDAVFVDADGASNRVLHKGVTFVNRNASQPASVIARGAFINDLVLPTNNVNFTFDGWTKYTYLPTMAKKKTVLIDTANGLIGKTIKIILPLQMGDVIYDYEFVFSIDNFTLTKKATKTYHWD